MSEHLRAAREKLRGAIADIDARLAELEVFKATRPIPTTSSAGRRPA